MSRYPVQTTLPGLTGVKVQVTPATPYSGTARFQDKNGVERHVSYGMSSDHLTLQVDDGSIVSFNPWPAPYSTSWSGSGLTVNTGRVGIATHLFAIAREVLATIGAVIAPSDNLFPDGRKLWAKLDPAIEFEERPDLLGYFRPKL